jgi:hypothetical protein
MRYFVAGVGFLLVWFVVAVVVGIVIVIVFPPQANANIGFGIRFGFGVIIGNAMVGIGTDWWNLPGTALGLLAGMHSWRASLEAARRKDAKKRNGVGGDPPTPPPR